MKKSQCFPDKVDITLTCASGVEKVLKSELKRLGLPEAPAVNGTLTFGGSARDIVRCNLNLRTADRVYVKLSEFSATSFDELYDGVSRVGWEDYVTRDGKIIVTGKCVKSALFAVSACQSIVKKAIAVRLSDKFGVNRLEENGAEYNVVFSVFKDTVTLYLNTSGVGLHKRGYRDMVGIAPIKETLASALLLMSDFYYERPFCDPFCGSGTIPIEAAKIALNVAPGLMRDFAFKGWTNFDSRLYEEEFECARDCEKRDRKPVIFASDIDVKAIKLATRHAERAGLKGVIDFKQKNVKDLRLSQDFGTIVSNPPYGERVYDKKEAEACYECLGKAVRQKDGWSTFVITSDERFERFFGKKADKKRKLYNSNKECNLYYYYGKKEKQND